MQRCDIMHGSGQAPGRRGVRSCCRSARRGGPSMRSPARTCRRACAWPRRPWPPPGSRTPRGTPATDARAREERGLLAWAQCEEAWRRGEAWRQRPSPRPLESMRAPRTGGRGRSRGSAASGASACSGGRCLSRQPPHDAAMRRSSGRVRPCAVPLLGRGLPATTPSPLSWSAFFLRTCTHASVLDAPSKPRVFL